MANVKRLTDRVKKIEKWIEINEDGPTLHNMDYLILSIRQANDMLKQEQQLYANFRNLAFEFIGQHELTEEWNEFLAEKEKENAVQEQSPEEVPSLTEAEDGEEVGEEDTKGKKPSKEEKSKEMKKKS